MSSPQFNSPGTLSDPISAVNNGEEHFTPLKIERCWSIVFGGVWIHFRSDDLVMGLVSRYPIRWVFALACGSAMVPRDQGADFEGKA